MFINLARGIWAGGGVTPVQAMDIVLTQYTAEQLSYYSHRVWEQPRVAGRNLVPGSNAVQNLLHQSWSIDIDNDPQAAGLVPPPPPQTYFRHIIYAFLLEATNLEAVFKRVVQEWVTGERLPFPTLETHVWLRTTEQLFFTNPQPPSIRALTSDIRPDRSAIRRNAYYRLLGFDLPQPGSTAFVKPDIANREFLRAWEALLRETWSAYANRNNLVGTNATDAAAMNELVREIRDMLTARRLNGALSREEFDAVSHFDWFHLVVLSNTAIVNNLTADSTSPAMRLKKIADMVGVPIHAKSDSLFQICIAMARVLEVIETGVINAGNVNMLYQGGGALAANFRLLWSHWQHTTGRAVKGMDGAIPAVRQPAAAPTTVLMPQTAVMPQTSRFQPAVRV
jgi:hypothetical protein